MAPTRLSHYEVIDTIGSGGMGTIYRARDMRLEREVALKVLPPALRLEESNRLAFRREARAAAQLSHPNIGVVYEIDEVDETTFIVLELIRGGRLADVLPPDGLPLDRALDYALQLADGLAYAHDCGIVHRDLKPDNILLSDSDIIKIIDFGLARWVPSLGSPGSEDDTAQREVTFSGKLAGTLAYMSPEQARGEPVDARSDVFAFGLVLFEMLSGRHPFRGKSPLETVGAILKDPVPPLSRTDLPAGLETTVRRCLEKAPDERFGSMRDVADALAGLRQSVPNPGGESAHPSTPTQPAPTVAVLPFADLSPDKDQDYFCQGIAEDVSSALGKLPGLRVAARTSTLQFRDRAAGLHDIGAALGVDHVLEGSVRTSGDRLRVNVQLNHVGDGYQVWSERYDCRLREIFEIQDEITTKIVSALELRLLDAGARTSDPPRRHTPKVEAYHLYLKGRHRWSRRRKGDLEDARGLFERATEIDPDYAAAFAGLADVYTLTGAYGFTRLEIARDRAKQAIERAIALDGSLSEAHQALGFYRAYFEYDLRGSEASYRRSIELDPSRPTPYSWLGISLSVERRFDEGIDTAGKAVEMDPLSPYAFTARAWALLLAGRTLESIEDCTRALEIEPEYALALVVSALGQARRRSFSDALRQARRAVTLSRRASIYLGWYGWVLGMAGDAGGAGRVLSELEANTEYVSPLYLAWIHIALGERERAYALLDDALAVRDPQLVYLDHPMTDPLRGESRFRELERRLFGTGRRGRKSA